MKAWIREKPLKLRTSFEGDTWKTAEDIYILKNAYDQSFAQMGRTLGRSAKSVETRLLKLKGTKLYESFG